MSRAVLHVAETTLGGVGQVLRDLTSAQAAAGWRVSVAAPPDAHVSELVRPSGGRLHPWSPGPRPGPRLPAELRALRRVVREERPDLVHLHSSMAGLCGRLVLRGRVPTLFQPHSWSFYAVDGAVRLGAVAWERAAARWAHVVLCVSDDERRLAERHGVGGRKVVVPNGVDLARFPAANDAERKAARGRLGAGDQPLAVCLGRLHRQKGQHLLLDAWPLVRDRVPDARLALVGSGPDEAALQARRVEGVHVHGHSDAVGDWLAAADVVVQPSAWEGMSLSVLEAMARGRSLVVTDVAGMREVVADDCGAVVARAAQPLAQAVAARLGDPGLAAREGAAGRRRAEQHHDLDARRAQVLALADELASRS